MKAPAIIIALCITAWAAPAAMASDADPELNQHYRALMGQLDAANQGRLRDAQRAWLAFRDKECAFKAQGHHDAASARSAHDACIEALTAQRAEQLQRELDCNAHGASCVPRRQDATAQAPSAADCVAEVGAQKAEQYVAQCQQVSPATHPPCNSANACALITDEIKSGCDLLGKDAPAFCAGYR
ncbi:lysozyme inhibitor LprI family protein [Dokdonella sp.]|uniref:lysozyme inhibitor LprI family protein n=1 Tax=Dokdonella sp. TaxID=2291710 RepID=UPI0027BA4A48|nr:lysozyme inhibitor LprI family protein [Dokdonella sp.]